MQGECKKAILLVFFAEPQPFLRKKCGNGGDFKQMLGVGDTKCGIYKSKWGNYKPNWAKRSLGFQPVIPDAAYLILLATP